MLHSLKKLWQNFSKRRHRQFYLLIILMILASLVEVVSIGAVLPFLGVLTSPDILFQHSLAQPLIEFLEISSAEQMLLPATIIFIVATLFSGVTRLLLLYVMTKLSQAAGADLSINIYRRTLYQKYAVHVQRNSSIVINGVINKTSAVVGGVITPIMKLVSSTLFIGAIIFTLISIDIIVASIASIGFGALYWIVIRLTRKRIQENAQCIAQKSTLMIKSLQEGLGGIRDVLLDGSQEFYCKLYRNADLDTRGAVANNAFIKGSPRFLMESLGMVLISSLAYSMSMRANGLDTLIPVLGALALGAQKLLPALQQAYSAYSSIKGSSVQFKDVLKLLDQPMPYHAKQSPSKPISFKKEICLKNIDFYYNDQMSYILKNIDLTIDKGSRIGFIGKTGSGKSTLVDIIMGLLLPTKGEIYIDNQQITEKNLRSWQTRIAHVSQSIYLADASIEENIAFAVQPENINHQRVRQAAEQAQISELIEQWPDKYQTFVGERGIRLSGGQRQRIGIARALYKSTTDVLIFDEATSALDNETEQAVMEAIDGLDKELTILIIAHRLNTLKGCDKIVEVVDHTVK